MEDSETQRLWYWWIADSLLPRSITRAAAVLGMLPSSKIDCSSGLSTVVKGELCHWLPVVEVEVWGRFLAPRLSLTALSFAFNPNLNCEDRNRSLIVDIVGFTAVSICPTDRNVRRGRSLYPELWYLCLGWFQGCRVESTACHLPCQYGSFLSLSLAQFSSQAWTLTCLCRLQWFTMPVGRVYQAPAVANTFSKNPQVFGSVSNSDLVITGRAVRSNKSKSKSPSPPSKTPGRTSKLNSSENKTAVSNSNRNHYRKSHSPAKPVKLNNSSTNKERKDKVNNNIGLNSGEKISNGLSNREEVGQRDQTPTTDYSDSNENNTSQSKSINGNINDNQVRVGTSYYQKISWIRLFLLIC